MSEKFSRFVLVLIYSFLLLFTRLRTFRVKLLVSYKLAKSSWFPNSPGGGYPKVAEFHTLDDVFPIDPFRINLAPPAPIVYQDVLNILISF